jgi:tripartite-type tricarboxylate transporter receptor subunit TctC
LVIHIDGIIRDSGARGKFGIHLPLVAPAGTPRDIVMKLNDEVAKALASPDVRKRFDDLGLVPKSSKPQEFGDFLIAEMTRWKAVLAAKKP